MLKFLYTQEGALIIQDVIIFASLDIPMEYWMANLLLFVQGLWYTSSIYYTILLYADFWLQQFIIELNLEDL